MRWRRRALMVALVPVAGVVLLHVGSDPASLPVVPGIEPPRLLARPPQAVAPTAGATESGVPTPATAPGAPVAGPQVSAEWALRTAAQAGIDVVAVKAYADAVLSVPTTCRLGWTTLAGIGWVESQHGSLGGRTLEADGRSSTPIIGPALDGGAFPAMPATTGGVALHGDPRWEHAVGPLQFLPSTWARWGIDADGDGVANPQDIDDAARAAADYLCATGQDLTSGSGWATAIFAYNHSEAYVTQVDDAATVYARRTDS